MQKIVIKVTKPVWRCATFRQDAVVHICTNAKTHYGMQVEIQQIM